jgi:DNA-directed RNA polymerase subunit RPC12/RpoP
MYTPHMGLHLFKVWQLPRLIAKPWRLAPELDDFDDDRCAAFIRDLRSVRTAGLFLALPIAMMLGLFLTGAASEVADAFPRASWATQETVLGRFVGVTFSAGMIAIVVSIAFTPYVALLRRALRRLIDRVRCPSCSYSLLGLPLVDSISASQGHAVRCPECGDLVNLAVHGLTPADVLAGVARTASTSHDKGTPLDRLSLAACAAWFIPLPVWVITGQPGWITAFMFLGIMTALVVGRGQIWQSTGDL